MSNVTWQSLHVVNPHSLQYRLAAGLSLRTASRFNRMLDTKAPMESLMLASKRSHEREIHGSKGEDFVLEFSDDLSYEKIFALATAYFEDRGFTVVDEEFYLLIKTARGEKRFLLTVTIDVLIKTAQVTLSDFQFE